MKKGSISSLDRLLQEITPEEQEKTNAKMLLAAKIADAMAAKGWNNKMLMDAMGKKNASEITRWLSGTHNFTMDTLIDLGRVLDTNFLNLEEKELTVQQFNISVVSYNSKKWFAASMLNETGESYSSFDETFTLCYNEPNGN